MSALCMLMHVASEADNVCVPTVLGAEQAVVCQVPRGKTMGNTHAIDVAKTTNGKEKERRTGRCL